MKTLQLTICAILAVGCTHDLSSYSYGKPTGKPGYAFSPSGKVVDVSGIPAGTLVQEPDTKELFRVPGESVSPPIPRRPPVASSEPATHSTDSDWVDISRPRANDHRADADMRRAGMTQRRISRNPDGTMNFEWRRPQ